jgi:hypothetical protein
MTVTTNFFDQPRLREDVRVTFGDGTCVLRLREQEYEITLDPASSEESRHLVDLLSQGGRSLSQLGRECPSIEDEIPLVLRDLDRFGLVTETEDGLVQAMPGAQFYRELRRFVERVKRRVNSRRYYQGLVLGSITREQLIGYALEYFHIVDMCPGLLAPSLSHHESRPIRKLLQGFFVSELDHDVLLERSLASVGIARAELEEMVPLPMTFSVCSSLGVYARTHPNSFKASLFLFEEPDGEFNEAFKARCEAVGLTESFYGPIFEHADINEDGEHDVLSKTLFAETPCISAEEQHTVKRHAAILVECLVLMEGQIIDYYGKPGARIPRCFG